MNLEDIPVDDEKTYSLYKDGKLLGTFQTESPLLRQWSKKLPSKNLTDVGNLVAAVRPGVLKCVDEDSGKVMIELYRERFNNESPVQYMHPALEASLKNSRGVMLMQEELIDITRVVTNFDKVEIHKLLKAVSKKKPEEIAAIKEKFIASATEKGIVTALEAKKIYESFEASGRYLFNLAHSISYGYLSYITTYLKANYPLKFFCAWMSKSDHKDDIPPLIRDAKGFGITVIPPDIRTINSEFSIINDNTIMFGFKSVMGCGISQLDKIKTAVRTIEEYCGKTVSQLSWLEFLVYGFTCTNLFNEEADVTKKQLELVRNLSKSVIENLIKAGALSCYGIPRNRLLHELRQFKQLSKTSKDGKVGGEVSWCANYLKSHPEVTCLLDLLKVASHKKKDGGAAHNDNRLLVIQSLVKMIENPPVRMTDTINDLVRYERELLNVAITVNNLDNYDCVESDTIISEYLSGKHQDIYCIKCEIARIKEVTCKRGKSAGRNMAFLSVMDNSGELDEVVIFPDDLDRAKNDDVMFEGALVLLWGSRDASKGSFNIRRIKPLTVGGTTL